MAMLRSIRATTIDVKTGKRHHEIARLRKHEPHDGIDVAIIEPVSELDGPRDVAFPGIDEVRHRRGSSMRQVVGLDSTRGRHSNSEMPDTLERAVTGRAKCRGCGRAIEKGELRFGEALPNPYREGDAVYWLHPSCAALMRPEKWLALARSQAVDVPERDELERVAEEGVRHPQLPKLARALRSPSARARCRQCRELIDKDAWRLDLQEFEEGRFSPSGSIHATCAEAYFGTRDILPRIRRLTPELADADAAEIEQLLAAPSAADGAREPALAKTSGEPELDATPEHKTAG